ncbi:MAG: site-specific DNA-methyltransferase, partial [Candidatus Odinarchaeota archaeon]
MIQKELENISVEFNEKKKIILHHGLSHVFLKTIPDKIIRLIITSPPYNLGKIYENEVEFDKYLMEQ